MDKMKNTVKFSDYLNTPTAPTDSQSTDSTMGSLQGMGPTGLQDNSSMKGIDTGSVMENPSGTGPTGLQGNSSMKGIDTGSVMENPSGTGPTGSHAIDEEKGLPVRTNGKTILEISKETEEDIKHYSITPDTFKDRVLYTNQITEFGNDFTWYVDKYSYNGNSVTRYGINASKLTIKGKAISLDTTNEKFGYLYPQTEKDFNRILGSMNESSSRAPGESSGPKSKGKQSNISAKNSEVVQKSASGSSNAGKLENDNSVVMVSTTTTPKTSQSGVSNSDEVKIKARADCVTHTEMEQDLLGKAVVELLSNKEAKAVLVDIFARKYPNTIQCEYNKQNKLILETHTIVLYKKAIKGNNVEILIIDPSNFQFSSHIERLNTSVQTYCQKTGILEEAQTITLIPLHKHLQIYSSKGKTGPNHDQYRDCIDVAVKIAFGLNTLHNGENIELTTITTLPVIQMISNQDQIDKHIQADLVKGIPVRIKQNSNINLVKGFYNVEKLITIIYTLLNGIQGNKKYEGKEAKMKDELQQKFRLAIEETKHVDALKVLYQLGEEFEGFYKKLVDYEVVPLGE